jgi:hypothetical protein
MKTLILILFLKSEIFIGDVPTGYLTKRGEYELLFRIQKDGGLISGINAAITDYLLMGISYGGMEIIGEKDPEFYPTPGILLKYLAIYETDISPSICFGISTQGFDKYLKERDRYEIKSKGVFCAISKSIYGTILNGGVNYTFERKDEKNGFDLFFSLDFPFTSNFSLFSDFSFGFNDDYNKNGILNIGLEISFEDIFFFKVSIRNLLNKDYTNRIFEIVYKGSL